MEEENKEITKTIGNMIDSKDLDNIQLASAIIRSQPDMIDSETLKGRWHNINNIINSNTIKYTELYCYNGGSDKVYIVLLNENKGNYNVRTCYGRRGSKLKIINKTTTPSKLNAERVFNKVVKEKLKSKGYKEIFHDEK